MVQKTANEYDDFPYSKVIHLCNVTVFLEKSQLKYILLDLCKWYFHGHEEGAQRKVCNSLVETVLRC